MLSYLCDNTFLSQLYGEYTNSITVILFVSENLCHLGPRGKGLKIKTHAHTYLPCIFPNILVVYTNYEYNNNISKDSCIQDFVTMKCIDSLVFCDSINDDVLKGLLLREKCHFCVMIYLGLSGPLAKFVTVIRFIFGIH